MRRHAVLAAAALATACAAGHRPEPKTVPHVEGSRSSLCTSGRVAITRDGVMRLCSKPSPERPLALISGLVVDRDSDRPISGATIVLRNAKTGQLSWKVRSDRRGRFQVDTAPGSYGAFVYYGNSRMCARVVVRDGTTVLLKTELKVERSVHLLESTTEMEPLGQTPTTGRPGPGRFALPACV